MPNAVPNRVNPYSDWVHDHPATLLAEPTPALLKEKRAHGPAGSGRLIVELGCGSGNFLRHLGAAHPEDQLVGFELRFKRLVKAARKVEGAGLANVWLLRAPAEGFAEFFSPGAIDQVHLNFPDPWPKPSQRKKRLLNAALLEQLQGALKVRGELHVKTDHSGYFLHALTLLRERPRWRIAQFSNDLHRGGAAGAGPRTEFEQLFQAKRKAIFLVRAVWEPEQEPPPDRQCASPAVRPATGAVAPQQVPGCRVSARTESF